MRARIVNGSWAPGTRLPEANVVESIGFSRTPIREAIRRLYAEGLVDFAPNKGAKVAEWTEQDIEDLFGLRLVLERYAVRLAAVRIDEETLGELDVLEAQMERLIEEHGTAANVEVSSLNNAFHSKIIHAAGSKSLLAILNSALTIPDLTGGDDDDIALPIVHRVDHAYRLPELHRSVSHHRELIAALRSHNQDWAESVIHTHILAGRAAQQLGDTAGPRLVLADQGAN